MLDIYADTRRPSILVQEMIKRAISGYTYFPAKAPKIGELSRMVIESVQIWFRRRAIEAELWDLSDHMLADIGVVRGDIARISREWAKSESPISRAKVIGPKSEIKAVVSPVQTPAFANDEDIVRAA